MRILLYLTIFLLLASCNNSTPSNGDEKQVVTIKQQQVLIDTIEKSEAILTKPSVLVLPPFDEIANEGISPNIQKIIETTISNDTTFTLIKFPYKQLMNVSYQNVYDKKYCKPITDKINTDIIIMTKIDQATRTGQMTSDRWNFQIKIYNTKSDNQILSQLTGTKLTSSEIESLIKTKQQQLFMDIKNSR